MQDLSESKPTGHVTRITGVRVGVGAGVMVALPRLRNPHFQLILYAAQSVNVIFCQSWRGTGALASRHGPQSCEVGTVRMMVRLTLAPQCVGDHAMPTPSATRIDRRFLYYAPPSTHTHTHTQYSLTPTDGVPDRTVSPNNSRKTAYTYSSWPGRHFRRSRDKAETRDCLPFTLHYLA